MTKPTRFHLRTRPLAESTLNTVADFVFQDTHRPLGLGSTGLGRVVARHLESDAFSGRAGSITRWHTTNGAHGPQRVVVAGLGRRDAYRTEILRRACAAIGRNLQPVPGVRLAIPVVAVGRRADAAETVRAAVEGIILGGYRFSRYLTEPDRRSHPITEVELCLPGGRRAGLARAVAFGSLAAAAANYARDLVSEPAGSLTPSRLAAEARRVAKQCRLGCEVITGAGLEKLRMGGLLGVGRGSHEPSYLIRLHWKPKGRKPRRKIALVGKGLTFDSGGLSLKSAEGMETMKADMAGAACVLAVLRALPEWNPPVEVTGLLAVAENMPGGGAIRPGDVLKMHSGTTVEVRNTDAEGRLVLGDALAWIGGCGVDEVIDLATLTGACVVALGPLCAGVMGTDRRLVDRILAAAERSGEMMWPLPLFDEYLGQLRSEVADMRNAGSRFGGAITAGLFLRKFVPDGLPWAHIDIAGTAFLDDDTYHTGRGATGAGVRTLLRYLESGGR